MCTDQINWPAVNRPAIWLAVVVLGLHAAAPVRADASGAPPASQPAEPASQPAEPASRPVQQQEDAADDHAGDTAIEPSTVRLSETNAAQGREAPRRLDPARIEINDRGDWVGVGSGVQLRSRFDQRFSSGGQEEASNHGLAFRRLRLLFGGAFVDRRLRTSLQLNLLPGALELIDAWAAYAIVPLASLRLGQFTVPFTRYRSQSWGVLSLADWSPVTNMFGAERQLGLEVFNTAARDLGWEYAAGVFSGINARASHAVGLTRVYGEQPNNPSDLTGSRWADTIHPELVARVAKNFGDINTDTNSDLLGGSLRSSIGLSAAWDIRPEVQQDLPLRLALEWLAKWNHFHLNTAGYVAWFDGREGMAFGPWGLFAEVGYRPSHWWEVALRYSHVHLTAALRQDAQAYAAEQIGDGSDPDKVSQYGEVGQQKSHDELALAVSLFVLGNSLKAQIEGAWVTEDYEAGRRHGFRLITQAQLRF